MARKSVIVISLILVLCSAAVVTSVWMLQDSGRLKAMVENLASSATGQTLRINGEFSVRLGRVVSVHATGIEWQNPAWVSRPGLLSLRELTLAVDLWSLVAHPVLVTDIQAGDGELVFEWTDGQFNWAAGSAEADATEADHPLPLLLERAALDNIRLRFIHPELTDALTVELSQARLQQDAAGYMVLDVDSVFDGRAVSIDGRVGTFPQLTVAGDIDYDLSIIGPNAAITASGGFTNLARLEGMAAEFRLAAPETAVLLDILNLPELTRGPADLAASLRAEGERLLASASGTVGEFEVQASGKVDRPGTLEGLAFDIISSGPAAGVLAGLAGIEGFPDRPYTLSARGNTATQGLVLEELAYSMDGLRLDASGNVARFPELLEFDIQFALAGDSLAEFSALAADLQLPELPFSVKGSLRDRDDDQDDDLDASLQLGPLSATITGEVTRNPGYPGSTFHYTVNAANLQPLSSLAGVRLTRPVALRADGTARVDAHAITVPQLDATLGPYRLSADASIPVHGPAADMRFGTTLQGNDFSALVNLVDTGSTLRLPPLPFELAADVRIRQDRVEANVRSLQLGRSRFVANSTITTGQGPPRITAQLGGKGASLAELLQGQGLEGIPAGGFELNSGIELSESTGIRISDLDFSMPGARVTGSLSSTWPGRPDDISFALNASGTQLDAVLPALTAYTPQDVAFDIQAQGKYTDAMVRIDAGRARIGSAAIDISGVLHRSPQWGAQGVRIQASGSSLSDLGTVAGHALPPLPFSLSAQLDGAANRIRADDVQLTAGNSSLRGVFEYDGSGRPRVNAELRSELVDLNELTGTPDTAEQADPAQPAQGERLLSTEPLPLAWLDELDGQAQLQVAELVVRNSRLRDLAVDASLSNGELDVRQLAARTQRGDLAARLRMRPVQEGTEISTELTATDVIVAVRKMSEAEYARLPRQTIDMNLTGSGNSMAELGASLNGFAWMRTDGGQIPSSRMSIMMGDFLSQLLGALNPAGKKLDYLTVECGGVYLEAENGKLTTAPAIVMLSNQILITASGIIDLATEKIDMVVETNPAKGVGISTSQLVNPFTKIGGTLGKPQLVLDPKGTAIEGGAAIVTGGVSLLAKGLWTRWIGSHDICGKVEEEARTIRQKRDPGNVPGQEPG